MRRIGWIMITTAALGLSADAFGQAGQRFYPLTPCRVVDTRWPTGPRGGPALANSLQRNFPIKGHCSVPTNAQSTALNFTVISPTAAGHLTVWPYGAPVPLVSTLNYLAGEPAIANGAIVPLGTDPDWHLAVSAAVAGGVGTVHLAIDVTGYFAP